MSHRYHGEMSGRPVRGGNLAHAPLLILAGWFLASGTAGAAYEDRAFGDNLMILFGVPAGGFF
jgi:hypothetical protein